MAYEFDVFISYRRWKAWPSWVRGVFIELFEMYLGEELAGECSAGKIWWDEHSERGREWPEELATRLAHSRVLVPLWSRQYFESEWCTAELAHMIWREGQTQARLIVPGVIHDGDRFPSAIAHRSRYELNDVVRVHLARDSPKWEQLEDIVIKWAADVAQAVREAPPFDQEWQAQARDELPRIRHSITNSTVKPTFPRY